MTWPVSADYLAAVARSHVRVVLVEVLDPAGTVLATLQPTGGSVSVDSRRDTRRTLTGLTVVNTPTSTGAWTDLTPSATSSLLSPLAGNELRVSRGVAAVAGQAAEMVPLGVFTFTEPVMKDDGAGVTITLDGFDRSKTITRSKWTTPYQVAAGTNLFTAVAAALSSRWAACPALTGIDTGATVGESVLWDVSASGDPWKDLCALATEYGCELFFDPLGVPVLRAIPSPTSGSPVRTFQDGSSSVLTTIERRLVTDDTAYNGVVVLGESTGGAAPVRGEAWDLSYGATGGRPSAARPLVVQSKTVTTAAQAQASAAAMLPRVLGLSEQVFWSMVPDPALDVWDLVTVTRGSVDVAGDVVIDALTVPLDVGASMTVTGRARQVWG